MSESSHSIAACWNLAKESKDLDGFSLFPMEIGHLGVFSERYISCIG